MTINEKLLQFIDSKDISQRKFTIRTGMSEGVLRRGKSIGADKLMAVKQAFPELNMNWLLFDEGDMTLTTENIVNEDRDPYHRDSSIDRIIDLRIDQRLKEAKEELHNYAQEVVQQVLENK